MFGVWNWTQKLVLLLALASPFMAGALPLGGISGLLAFWPGDFGLVRVVG